MLGLSLSRVVLSTATTVRLRMQQALPQIYPPVMLWCVFLFLFALEVWLSAADIGLREGDMSILSLMALTMIPIGIIILVEFLSYQDSLREPIGEERTAQVSQEEQFARVRSAFFIVLAAVPVLNLATTIYTDHTIVSFDAALQILVILGAAAGLLLRSSRSQLILPCVMIAVMSTFIVMEYEVIGLLPALLTT